MSNPASPKLYGLDHLRALAITVVFLFHYFILSGDQPSWLPDFAGFGWTGVDLFFVLSGFLISSQLFAQIQQGQKISFRTFFLKRFFRIIPAFAVTVGLYFCLPFFREKEQLPPLWKFLTFTQNFGLDLKAFGTFSHAWSLCVEEHFYLLLPLTLILLQGLERVKNGIWLMVALFVFGFLVRAYSFNVLYQPYASDKLNGIYWFKYLYYPTYNRLDGLLMGVSIAAICQFLPAFWSKIAQFGNFWVALSLTLLTGAYFLCEDMQTFYATLFGFPLISMGYGFLVVGAISPTSFLYKWNSGVTSFVATISYALYLTHKGVIHMTQQFLEAYHLDANLVLCICIITSIAGAYILHLSVEKPFMKYRDRLLRSK